jgi:hypothetical protein
VAAAILLMATPGMRVLLWRIHYNGESIKDVALAIGVDRSTLSRRLSRFYEQVRAKGWAFCMAA